MSVTLSCASFSCSKQNAALFRTSWFKNLHQNLMKETCTNVSYKFLTVCQGYTCFGVSLYNDGQRRRQTMVATNHSSFAVAAPTTWNSLPLHIRNSSSIFGFRRQPKLFSINQPLTLCSTHLPTPAPQSRWCSSDIARSTNLFTYFLTITATNHDNNGHSNDVRREHKLGS